MSEEDHFDTGGGKNSWEDHGQKKRIP